MESANSKFQMPEKIFFEEETVTDTYGKLYAGPFEKGFGTTLGNSLRRVLLSSIEGVAVTNIRLLGLYHEFAVISGIKEDAIDIVLNIKKLRFSLQGDKPKTVRLASQGPLEVKGKHITNDLFVKVLSEEQHILTLDYDAKIDMELTVEKGKGYRSAEENKKDDLTVDSIAIDSIFTPIKKVNFWVESARVGQATDYDKLVMEIWTDGSLTPLQAITQAANILIDHILLFSLEADEELKEEEPLLPEEPKSESEFNMNLLKSVDELELSVRSYNCLKNASIETIADLVQKSENEMLKTKNFGRKSLVEIKEILKSMNLRFGLKIDKEMLEKMKKELAKNRDNNNEDKHNSLNDELLLNGGDDAS
jgi:DNA-directed RNA polymerase subunit alpha